MEEYNKLFERYTQLKNQYTQLEDQYTQLEKQYSENTIIQSMNDMKLRYEELVANTVSFGTYEKTSEKYEKLRRVVSSSEILIEHITNVIKKLENQTTEECRTKLYKAQIELLILKEILQEASS